MSRPSPKHSRWAEQLLVLEGAVDGTAAAAAESAARIYDKLVTRLTPLLGAIGVQTLLRRSAKLANGAFASLDDLTIVAVFEKRPNDYLQTSPRGEEFEKMVKDKKLEVVYLRPLDLSIDETLLELRA